MNRDLTAGTITYSWRNDSLIEGLIAKIKDGTFPETREFLKPIFRWTKVGNKSFDMERAFDFAEWMQLISTTVDPLLGIQNIQQQVQPKYAFNTIITMSQRSGNVLYAQRAYARMTYHGYQPDVFTLTALLDVVGRKGSLESALDIYCYMMSTEQTLPNIVSFITLIRIAGIHPDNKYGSEIVSKLYSDAKDLAQRGLSNSLIGVNNTLELSVCNAALSACVHLSNIDLALLLLKDMCLDPKLPLSSLTNEILAKLCIKLPYISTAPTLVILDSDAKSPLISEPIYTLLYLQTQGILSVEQIDVISSLVDAIKDGKTDNLARFYPGCLGPDASPNLRKSVMTHDLLKLVDRVNDGSINPTLVENDFTTLIHQCRKRKWPEQIIYILQTMYELSVSGYPDKLISPMPHLLPTLVSYEAAFDGYFNTASGDLAWSLYESVNDRGEIIFDVTFYTFLIKGFYYCGRADLGIRVYYDMRQRGGIAPTRKLVKGMMCGLGGVRVKTKPVASGPSPSATASMLVQSVQEDGRSPAPKAVSETYVAEAVSILSEIAGEGVRQSCERDTFKYNESQQLMFPQSFHDCFLCTLLESCALLGAPENIDMILEWIATSTNVHSNLKQTASNLVTRRHPNFVIVCLMATCAYNDTVYAHNKLLAWQRQGVLPRFPFLHIILSEALSPGSSSSSQANISASLSTLPFSGFLRVGAVKYLHYRSPFIRRILRLISGERSVLYYQKTASIGTEPEPEPEAVAEDGKDGLLGTEEEAEIDDDASEDVGERGEDDESSDEAEDEGNSKVGSNRLEGHGGEEKSDVIQSKLQAVVMADESSDNINGPMSETYLAVAKSVLETGTQPIDTLLSNYASYIITAAESPQHSGDAMQTAVTAPGSATDVSPAIYQLATALFMQHLYTRLLVLRNKEGKHRLQSHCLHAVSSATEASLWKAQRTDPTTSNGAEYTSNSPIQGKRESLMGTFICECLRASKCIHINSRQLAKIFGLLFHVIQQTTVIPPLSEENKDIQSQSRVTVEDTAPLSSEVWTRGFLIPICKTACDLAVSLEIWREFQKSFSIMSLESVRELASEATLKLLCAGREKPVKLVQFIQSHNLCISKDHINKLEASLLNLFIEDNTQWTALTLYLGHARYGTESITKMIHALLHVNLTDLACRLICRYNMTDCPDFKHLIAPTELLLSMDESYEDSEAQGGTDTKGGTGYYTLPEGVSVHFVDSSETLAHAREILLESADVHVVGLDVEWKPFSTGNVPNKCSLLQIACVSAVFLFDLMVMEQWEELGCNTSRQTSNIDCLSTQFSAFTEKLFTSDNIVKLGFGFATDLHRLQSSYPNTCHYKNISPLIDLTQCFKLAHLFPKTDARAVGSGMTLSTSLSTLSARVIGLPLDKRMQRSDWERRPLIPQQLQYAALDAYILVEIYRQVYDQDASNIVSL